MAKYEFQSYLIAKARSESYRHSQIIKNEKRLTIMLNEGFGGSVVNSYNVKSWWDAYQKDAILKRSNKILSSKEMGLMLCEAFGVPISDRVVSIQLKADASDEAAIIRIERYVTFGELDGFITMMENYNLTKG